MKKAVKIRMLTAPCGNLSKFDPGAYLSGLVFYETSDEITEDDRDGMAKILHFLASLATDAKSRYLASSVVRPGTSAYDALQSHFGDLPGWGEIASPGKDIVYSQLVQFLARFYPPQKSY